jgi:hypothetical protein
MVSTVREGWKILFGATTAFGVSSGMLGGFGVWPLLCTYVLRGVSLLVEGIKAGLRSFRWG